MRALAPEVRLCYPVPHFPQPVKAHTSTQRAHRALKAHTSTQRAHRALKAHTSTQRAHKALKAHTFPRFSRPIGTANEAFTDQKRLGKRLSDEGHGFSRAVNSLRLTASAAEVRFTRHLRRTHLRAKVQSRRRKEDS